MIDEVRLSLAALRTSELPVADDLVTVPVPDQPTARLALDRHGRPHLLLHLPPEDGPGELPAPRIATLDVGLRQLVIGSSSETYLDVACLFEAVAEVFEHFVVAVLDEVEDEGLPPVTAVLKVLEKWRRFLEPTPSGPSREKLASVFGELLVLLDVLREDPVRRLDVWTGPFGGRHDFRRAEHALEVKTTRSHTGRTVTVNGEDQLDPPADGALHLQLIRLEEVAGGDQSVSVLVDALLELGTSAEALFDALTAMGLPAVDIPVSGEVTFEVRERRTFVVDDGLPRIVPASFVAGARPVGVVDLTYEIDLDHALANEVDEGSLPACRAADRTWVGCLTSIPSLTSRLADLQRSG